MFAPPRVSMVHAIRQRAATPLRRGTAWITAWIAPHRWLASSRLARAAFAVVILGVALRLGLVLAGWPTNDSDESTMGIMGLHIAARRDAPIFFYGQRYMGAFEAYLAAGAFHLFGSSLVTLRLGMVLLAALWLGCMYLLARALFTPALALFACALLAIGPPEALYRELWAGGGYGETLLFGTLVMLLATWLARTSATGDTTPPTRDGLRRYVRLAGFVGWGLAAGLGVWSDTLVLPFVLTSGALLIVFCRREWRAALPYALGGLALGAFPLLVYAVAAPDHNPLAGALSVQRSSNAWSGNVPALLVGQVVGTLLVALPTITGGASLCALPASASWPLAHPNAQTLLCTSIHGLWGLGYVALLVLALVASVRGVRRLRIAGDHAALAREGARLALLVSAGFTLLLFVSSPVAARSPNVVMRYLLGLLVALPAVLAPLWEIAACAVPRPVSSARNRLRRTGRSPNAPTSTNHARGPLSPTRDARAAHARGLGAQRWVGGLALVGLAVVALAYLAGIVSVAQAVPQAHATNQRQVALTARLAQLGVTRVYSDYWTCGWLIFDSRERVVCAALDPSLQPDLDRYPPFRALVQAAPAPTYVFPLDSAQATAFATRLASTRDGPTYTRETFAGYVIYRPARH